MKFIDFNVFDQSDFLLNFELIIVGSGAAGLYLAAQHSHKKVLIIESGEFLEKEKYQILNKIYNSGKELNSAEWGRKRVIGGTTISWGGQSLPFQPVDFEPRAYSPNNKVWPISLDELEPHYYNVNKWLGIDTLDYRNDISRLLGYKHLAFNPKLIDFHFSKWAKKPNFNDIIAKNYNDHITILYNSTVKELHLDKNKITSITLSNCVTSKKNLLHCPLVLANHTIESVRLLLILNKNYNFLTQDKINLLGSGFGEHPCMIIGELETNMPYKVQRALNTQLYKGVKYSVRLSIAEDFLKTNKLLNISASLLNHYDNEFNPYEEIFSFKLISGLVKLLKPKLLFGFFKSVFAFIFHRFIYKYKSTIRVVVMTEQEWIADSRIYLSDDLDSLGMPVVNLNWKISDLTPKTIIVFTKELKKEFSRLNIGELKIGASIASENYSEILSKLSDVNHQMGGAVFGNDPKNSILDKNLRVHEIENLYVASCASFPSFSHSNPTLTLLALVDKMNINFTS